MVHGSHFLCFPSLTIASSLEALPAEPVLGLSDITLGPRLLIKANSFLGEGASYLHGLTWVVPCFPWIYTIIVLLVHIPLVIIRSYGSGNGSDALVFSR